MISAIMITVVRAVA